MLSSIKVQLICWGLISLATIRCSPALTVLGRLDRCQRELEMSRLPFANIKTADGSIEAPYLVCSFSQLNEIRNYLDSHFILGANIDASVARVSGAYVDPDEISNSGDEYFEGWDPIGEESLAFTGSLDGNGKKISNLYIYSPKSRHSALFASTCQKTSPESSSCEKSALFIKDLTLDNLSIVGGEKAAGVAVFLGNTAVNNVNISGSIVGDEVGGIAVDSFSDISNVISKATVESRSGTAGGIVANLFSGMFAAVSNRGDVFGGGEVVGGLVGLVKSDSDVIFNSVEMSGQTVSRSDSEVYSGGAIGVVESALKVDVVNSYVSGAVDATFEASLSYVGGFIGVVKDGNSVLFENVFNLGNVEGTRNVGGIVGEGKSMTFQRVFSRGMIHGQDAGGLVGRASESNIYDSYVSSELVSGVRGAGGLIGSGAKIQVRRSYSNSNVESRDGSLGGFWGAVVSGGSIDDSFLGVGYLEVTGSRRRPRYGILAGSIRSLEVSQTFVSDNFNIVTGRGPPEDQGEAFETQIDSLLRGPLVLGNSGAGEIFENWNFDELWSMKSGEYPFLKCPSDDENTEEDESWIWACSIWNDAQ